MPRWIAIAVVAWSLAAVAGCSRGRTGGGSESVDATVDALLSSPHGVDLDTPADRERLDRVKQNPAPYVDAIAARLDAATPASLVSDPKLHATFAAGVHLLGLVGGPRAGDVLMAWFERLHVAVASATPESREPLMRLRANVLLALSPQPRASVVSRILEALPRMSYSERLIPLRYLAESTKGDAAVLARLKLLHEDPASPLHGDRTLGVVIEKLTVAPSR